MIFNHIKVAYLATVEIIPLWSYHFYALDQNFKNFVKFSYKIVTINLLKFQIHL